MSNSQLSPLSPLSDARTYTFIGERLCLDFCNTGENRSEGYVGELLGNYRGLVAWAFQADLLNEADAKRVESLEATVDQLSRSGKFTEASAPAAEALTVCESLLGQDHWRTVNARRTLATLIRPNCSNTSMVTISSPCRANCSAVDTSAGVSRSAHT